MTKRSCLVASLLALFVLVSLSAAAKKGNVEGASPKPSITVKGKPKTSVLVGGARISFQDAMEAALNAVPGKVASGELTVEDGGLQFEFEIVTAAKKVMDVSIDAGDGKVLDVDEGEDE